jgi:hypothetical protein
MYFSPADINNLKKNSFNCQGFSFPRQSYRKFAGLHGFSCPIFLPIPASAANHPEELANAIAFYATNPTEATQWGNNARAYALKHLERKSVVRKFESELVKKLHDSGMKSK